MLLLLPVTLLLLWLFDVAPQLELATLKAAADIPQAAAAAGE